IRRLLKLKKSWSGRIKNTIRNGELKDFYVAISPFNIKSRSGNIIFFKDITSEILLEKNLRHSKKLQAVSAMAASIVSDFEAILADVTGMLVNAAESSDVSRNLQALLGDSLNKIDGAQQLLRQLKLFSCDRNFDEKPVEIARVLEETIKVLRASLPVTISLITEVDFRGHVKADANQLQQIILSLGTNAFKAIRSQGEILFKLREPSLYELQLLGNKRPGRLWICLEVIDSGCGIPPENIGKVFDPFFTSSKINNNSGLGLAVIQAMVERMGGCIKVESKIEEGSKFVVYLPLSEDEKSIEAKNISNSDSDTEKTRVIVVDDEEMICKIYRMGLKRYGYEVTSFTDSERALKAFQHRPGNFDLLITDMMMPKINGDELTRQMLSIRPDLPVILCSGFISELDEQKLQDSGIKKCIEKPLDVAELDKAIKSLLY
ncbi:MAG: hybrid sensor histidine kinase/response regulator, partial [Candidatus Rifleibacteriota bacterium]